MEVDIVHYIRETTLTQTMPDLGKTHMPIALKIFVKKFMPKEWAYKILMNKDHEVE